MSAKPADKSFHQQKTFLDRRLRTKDPTDTKTIFMPVKKTYNSIQLHIAQYISSIVF